MEIPIAPICVDCGENLPEIGSRCDECRENALNTPPHDPPQFGLTPYQ